MPEQDLHPGLGKDAKSHQNRKKIARNQGREPVTHRWIGIPNESRLLGRCEVRSDLRGHISIRTTMGGSNSDREGELRHEGSRSRVRYRLL